MSNRMPFYTALALTSTFVSAAVPSGSTLSECNTFANLFSNTCTVTSGVPEVLSSLSGHAGTDMNCAGEMRCPGTTSSATYTTSNYCTFARKLCVSCSEDSAGVVKIKV